MAREHNDPTVTIQQVARSMGLSLPKETAWAIGTAMANAYKQDNNGTVVPKELREKTNGSGSHCFAVYPLSYVPRIRQAIEQAGVEQDRQGNLL